MSKGAIVMTIGDDMTEFLYTPESAMESVHTIRRYIDLQEAQATLPSAGRFRDLLDTLDFNLAVAEVVHTDFRRDYTQATALLWQNRFSDAYKRLDELAQKQAMFNYVPMPEYKVA